MHLRVACALIGTFLFCSFNVVLLELLVKYSPRCGDLIAFAQFLLIACYGLIKQGSRDIFKPTVPLREYVVAVVLFYGSTMCGNLALGCHISMPIQMIFKSGSVLGSLILGVLILKRSYTITKYISVIMISVGIATCMMITAEDKTDASVSSSTPFTNVENLIWFLGIFLLISSLFLGAALGVVQEKMSLKYGKHPEELLFYSHFLALPGFFFFASNIKEQAQRFSDSEVFTVPYVSISLPIVWLYLGLSAVTQLFCVKCVYILATEMSSLAVNVVLTLRKFLSLVISIYYFKNPFTVYHWFGTALVFVGTMLFTGVLEGLYKMLTRERDDAEKVAAKKTS